MYIYGNSIVSVVHSSMIQFKTTAHTKVIFTLRAPDLGLCILALFGLWGDFFVCTYYVSCDGFPGLFEPLQAQRFVRSTYVASSCI